MTTHDEFRRLGADLLTFAKDTAPSKERVLFTRQWVITRVQDVHQPAGVTYSWRARKGVATPLEHTLYVESDADERIYRVVLSCAIALDLAYETYYWAEHDQITTVGFAQRRIIDPAHEVWQFLGEPPLLVEEALNLVPTRMSKSFLRGEFASVS